MKLKLVNATALIGGRFERKSVIIDNGYITDVLNQNDTISISKKSQNIVDLSNKILIPGLIDVHVHLREPGFFYKETIKLGSLAAAKSGYTAVFAMPNLKPCPDSLENLLIEQNIIDKDAVISVYPYATVTKGENGEEIVDFESLKGKAIAFSDDGKGVQKEETMLSAMQAAAKCNAILALHEEDNSLLSGGYIHDGEYAKAHKHKGISSASEYKMIERDIILAKKTKCKLHICHISTKESVELIRSAKKDGVDITAETAPHYLILSEEDLIEDGRFKMNPPLRSVEDKKALISGIIDGTIDIIATDHAPHAEEEKNKGLEKSSFGITGLETAFPILYTYLVKKGIITLENLIELMSLNPAKRFNIESGIAVGKKANLACFDLNTKYNIESKNFISKGKSTPFDHKEVYGECEMTIFNGRIVWKKNLTRN